MCSLNSNEYVLIYESLLAFFYGQVIAACIYPELINSDKMPLDVRERAKTLLGECLGGSVGENYLDILETVRFLQSH